MKYNSHKRKDIVNTRRDSNNIIALILDNINMQSTQRYLQNKLHLVGEVALNTIFFERYGNLNELNKREVCAKICGGKVKETYNYLEQRLNEITV